MHISKELKVIREILSLTQEDLSLIIGVSLDTISRWENEKTDIEEKNIELIYNYAFGRFYFNCFYNLSIDYAICFQRNATI